MKSLVDAAFSLQREAQVHYPNLHENPKKQTSQIKCITNKLLLLNNANIKHNFLISPFGYFVTKHTYIDYRINVSWKLETNKGLTLKL